MPINRIFFISKKKEIAYLSIAKSGCTSIKSSLGYLRDTPLDELPLKVHDQKYYNRYFLDVVKDDCSYLKNCFKFTFIRNPIQRVISFYKNKILSFDPAVTPYYTSMGLEHNMPFEDFISKLVTIDHTKLEQHLLDQHLSIINGGNIVVDFIGKLEEINIHWGILNRHIDESLPLKNLNQSRAESSVFPSENMLNILKKYYKIDMYLFGYENSMPVSKEIKDMKHEVDKIVAEEFINKKLSQKGRSQNEKNATQRYRMRTRYSPLDDNDINTIINNAIFLESIELNRAFELMSIAKKLRPNGPLISKKIEEYKRLKQSQEKKQE